MRDSTDKINNLKKLWNKVNKSSGINIANEELNIIEQIGNFFSAGSYYYYIFNFDNLQMEFVSEGVMNVVELSPDSFSLDALLKLYHPEDLNKMYAKEGVTAEFLFNEISINQIIDYKVVYLNRIITPSGVTKTILHQAKALMVSENGKISKVLGVHTDVSYLNAPIDHKVSFISTKYPSYYSISTDHIELEETNNSVFTNREIEVINLISDGFTTTDIAKSLFISPDTVKTHKKNILKKVNVKNAAQLITHCIREGII